MTPEQILDLAKFQSSVECEGLSEPEKQQWIKGLVTGYYNARIDEIEDTLIDPNPKLN